MIDQARLQVGSHIFREISMLVAWCIWTHRNAIIFDEGLCLLMDGRMLLGLNLAFFCIRPNQLS